MESDHKPLEMIQLKNLTGAPPRQQRMLLCLQNYDVALKYKSAPEMLLADRLSKLPCMNRSHIDLDIQINLVHFSTDQIKNCS